MSTVLHLSIYMGRKGVLRLCKNHLRADFVAKGVLECHKLLKSWKILVQKGVLERILICSSFNLDLQLCLKYFLLFVKIYFFQIVSRCL